MYMRESLRSFEDLLYTYHERLIATQKIEVDHYVALLVRLYEGKMATIQACAKSRKFQIRRDVTQCDPISAMLFIAIMQDLLGGTEVKGRNMSKRRTGCPVAFLSEWDEVSQT